MPTPRAGYTLDGVRVPSVTQVLGVCAFTPTDALCSWAAKLAREGKNWKDVRNRAGFVGTAAHSAIEGYPNEPEYNPEFTPEEWERVHMAFQAHGEWVKRRRPQILLQEVQLVSKELRVGGTPDLVVKVNGEPYLTDHKTSKSIDAKAVTQVSAYAHMVKEQTGIDVAGAIIFHHPEKSTPSGKRYLKENGEFPFKAVPLSKDVLLKGLEAFKAARALYELGPELKAALGLPEEFKPWRS